LSLCLAKHHAMTYGGVVLRALRILNLGTRWRRVVSTTPRPLYPRGSCPRSHLYGRLGGPQSRSGRGGEEKKIPSLPLPGIEPLPSSHYTELLWLITVLATIQLTDTGRPSWSNPRVVPALHPKLRTTTNISNTERLRTQATTPQRETELQAK